MLVPQVKEVSHGIINPIVDAFTGHFHEKKIILKKYKHKVKEDKR